MVRDHFTVCCEMIFAVIGLQFAVISLQQQIDPILTYDHTPTLINNLSLPLSRLI